MYRIIENVEPLLTVSYIALGVGIGLIIGLSMLLISLIGLYFSRSSKAEEFRKLTHSPA